MSVSPWDMYSYVRGLPLGGPRMERLRKMLRRYWTRPFLGAALGTLWLGGCVTDAQFRDFLTSSLVRTFWQTLATAFQAAVVGANG